MAKLFIIGNGFDRAHGLKSSFYDFWEYVKKDSQSGIVLEILNEAEALYAKMSKKLSDGDSSSQPLDSSIENVQKLSENLISELEKFNIKGRLSNCLLEITKLDESSDFDAVNAAVQSVKKIISFGQDLQLKLVELNQAFDPLYPYIQSMMKWQDIDSPYFEKIEMCCEQFGIIMNNMANYRDEYDNFCKEIERFLELIRSHGFVPTDVFHLEIDTETVSTEDEKNEKERIAKKIKWGKFEIFLGYINFFKLFAEEPYSSKAANTSEHIVKQIKEMFAKWIDSLKEDIYSQNPKLAFSQLISGDALFLTFNYTKTLEIVYHVKNVLHIHGETMGDIIVGHQGTTSPAEIGGEYVDYDDKVKELNEYFKKPTKRILSSNKLFFDSIAKNNILEVYSYGFSYEEVDLPYIREMCKHLLESTIWFFENYNPKECEIFEERVKECGFRGGFNRFECKQ